MRTRKLGKVEGKGMGLVWSRGLQHVAVKILLARRSGVGGGLQYFRTVRVQYSTVEIEAQRMAFQESDDR